eukprot:4642422-Pyramimonas_sp.AAC.1
MDLESTHRTLRDILLKGDQPVSFSEPPSLVVVGLLPLPVRAELDAALEADQSTIVGESLLRVGLATALDTYAALCRRSFAGHHHHARDGPHGSRGAGSQASWVRACTIRLVGLHAAIKPLLSRSTTGEFNFPGKLKSNSPQIFACHLYKHVYAHARAPLNRRGSGVGMGMTSV